MMIQKLYVLVFISIWFITISDWWKYSLVPIIMSLAYLISDMFFRESGYTHIYFFGIMLGLIYVLFLSFLSRKYQFNAIEKVRFLVFDISKLLFLGLQEKKIYIEKKDNFNSEKFESISNMHQNSLNFKIKNLQSFLRYKNKSVLNLKERKESFNLGLVIIILLSPFLFFMHYLAPVDTSIIHIGSFQYETKYLALRIFFYFFNTKLFNLIVLSVWFFTTRNILKYGIFFNVIIAVFQFVTVLDNTESRADESELITALPIMIPILLTFLLLHRVIKYKSKNDILNEEIEKEIQEVITQLNAVENKENELIKALLLLRGKKNILDKEDYFSQLKALKSKLQNSLVN
ncbi:hypothetical protein [Cellulophaga sp. L1A9]|uniref:hypothetical protein n=1 Tax=Cellulophaga sp. L1A9 TaxID=2686362 RepID=UPI00131C28E7|nr:hypothetical protein [Cellulophaga sp. L1A9]